MAVKIENRGSNNRILIHESVERTGNMKIVIEGNNNLLDIGARTRLGNGIMEIRNHRSIISIGEDCFINGTLRCRAHETRLLIGSKTTMMWVDITLHEKGVINIGCDCMFSGEVKMDVSDMHSILDVDSGRRINPPKDIEIENHVWIGQGVHILKGCHIGHDSILGAKALITSSIPNNSIAVGIPAKVVKSGISWHRKLLPMPEIHD